MTDNLARGLKNVRQPCTTAKQRNNLKENDIMKGRAKKNYTRENQRRKDHRN
jgi:hypothetical protein